MTLPPWKEPNRPAKESLKTKLTVPDMSCGHCTAAIDKEIKAADHAAIVSFDLSGRIVTVQSALGTKVILATIKDAGYKAAML